MNSEGTDSLTVKAWDRSTVGSSLENAVQELATRVNTSPDNIVVTRSGPNTFTASIRTSTHTTKQGNGSCSSVTNEGPLR